MFRTSLGVGDTEAPAVLQRRHRPARGLDLRRIDLRQENAGLYAALGEHLAPGRNDQRGRAVTLLFRVSIRTLTLFSLKTGNNDLFIIICINI